MTQIFMFGYYGRENVGDDAIIYVLLQELDHWFKNAIFAVFSPISVEIPYLAYNDVKYIKPSIAIAAIELLKSSILVIGGGTHINDYGNKIDSLRTLLILFFMVICAKLFRKKIFIVGNGIGPLQSMWGKFLAKSICLMADYISVRDKESFALLLNWGLGFKSKLSFDLSVLIQLSSCDRLKESDRKVLGVSVTPIYEIYFSENYKDLILLDEISKSLNAWLDKTPAGEVHLFVFHGGTHNSDFLITKLLQEKLCPSKRVKLIPYNPDPLKVLIQIKKCHAFIGMKYHSCAFAYIAEIPLLIIEYHPKCRAFAKEVGLPNYAVISLIEVLRGNFGPCFDRMKLNPSSFKSSLPLSVAIEKAKGGLSIFDTGELTK